MGKLRQLFAHENHRCLLPTRESQRREPVPACLKVTIWLQEALQTTITTGEKRFLQSHIHLDAFLRCCMYAVAISTVVVSNNDLAPLSNSRCESIFLWLGPKGEP
jgi:hypothetical protein